MVMADITKIPSPIGEDVKRVDVYEKVIGSAVYTDDIQFGPQLLHARIKRSPHPHALVKSIDISKAEALPGVKVIVTGDDFPNHIGLYLKDKYIFARDRVRFIGEPVAGVAAVTDEIAEKAVELIEVEYEPLEPVFDPEYGASPEAPLIHPDLEKYEVPNFIFPKPGTNIANHFKIRKGDTEAAFKKCAAVVERTYRIPHVQHVPIEPHVAIAKVDENGQVTALVLHQNGMDQRARRR